MGLRPGCLADHPDGWACPGCRPDLWEGSPEHSAEVRLTRLRGIVENLVRWNRAYRAGEAEVSDARYDLWEQVLRDECPGHPFLQMVGHEEDKIREILDFL